jgi:hypothetical protein
MDESAPAAGNMIASGASLIAAVLLAIGAWRRART